MLLVTEMQKSCPCALLVKITFTAHQGLAQSSLC